MGSRALEIDANHHLPDLSCAASVGGAVRQAGLETSSLVHFGALLHQDRSTERRTRERARECLLAAAEMSVPAVVFFPGRNSDLSMEANYEGLAAFLQELVSVPVPFPTKILLENWPGFHRNSIAPKDKEAISILRGENLALGNSSV
jgi:sugar phosphate isomerase/epimerase